MSVNKSISASVSIPDLEGASRETSERIFIASQITVTGSLVVANSSSADPLLAKCRTSNFPHVTSGEASDSHQQTVKKTLLQIVFDNYKTKTYLLLVVLSCLID